MAYKRDTGHFFPTFERQKNTTKLNNEKVNYPIQHGTVIQQFTMKYCLDFLFKKQKEKKGDTSHNNINLMECCLVACFC